MKAIVNGKMYDTETAELIGSIVKGQPYDDDYSQTELYQKVNGEFFVYTENNQPPLFCVYDAQNKITSGWHIFPISIHIAKLIAEHFNPLTYIRLFGEPSE